MRAISGVLLAIVVATALSACGSLKTSNYRTDRNTFENLIGEVVASDGAASSFYLRTRDAGDFVIRPSGIGLELWQLQGMIVGVNGRVLGDNIVEELPMLEVEDYDIIATPSGVRPIVGYVGADDLESITLFTIDGQYYHIEGDSKLDFSYLDGAKVWVVGSISLSVYEPNERWLDVEEFGLIREGPHTIRMNPDIVRQEKPDASKNER